MLEGFSNELHFTLNGEPVRMVNPDPGRLLSGLTGTASPSTSGWPM